MSRSRHKNSYGEPIRHYFTIGFFDLDDRLVAVSGQRFSSPKKADDLARQIQDRGFGFHNSGFSIDAICIYIDEKPERIFHVDRSSYVYEWENMRCFSSEEKHDLDNIDRDY